MGTPEEDRVAMQALYSLPAYGYPQASAETPRTSTPEDQAILDELAGKYKTLAPIMRNSAVTQMTDQSDERQLEYHHPLSSENPTPGRVNFEMFRPMQGDERKGAIAADALHYLGGNTQDDSGPPVDPTWRKMRDDLWASRTPPQRAIDDRTYHEEAEPGQSQADWAGRDRADAYVRAGVFPEQNPEWNRAGTDPARWTPEQQAMFAQMQKYLTTGGK